jgi:hypothetical protein
MKRIFPVLVLLPAIACTERAVAIVSISNYSVTCSTLTASGTADTQFVGVNVTSPNGLLVSSYQDYPGVPQFYAPVINGQYSFTLDFSSQAPSSSLTVTLYEAPQNQPLSRTDFLVDVNVTDCSAPTPPVQPIRLTGLCSPDPATLRVWRVRNANPFNVTFTWDIYESGQSGLGYAPANNDYRFSTDTVSGANTMRVFVGGVQQDVKASNPAQCISTTP